MAVAAKVRFAHMVICADHAALEYRKEVFSGVAVLVTAKAGELLCAVVDRIVSAKFTTDALIDRAFIRYKVGGAVNIGNEQSADVLCVDVSDMKAADMTFTLHKGNNCLLGSGTAVSEVTGFTAYIGFIGFDYAAATA